MQILFTIEEEAIVAYFKAP